MTTLAQRLLRLEPLELSRLSAPDAPACLLNLRSFLVRERTLLEHAAAVAESLRVEPPPPTECADESAQAPWWSAMPAAYVAALFQHVAVPREAACANRRGRLPIFARQSAVLAREALRGMGVPFAHREHAVALIAAQDRPFSLTAGGAPPETMLRLSCTADLRALYWLVRAGMRVFGDEERLARLESFAERAARLDVFGHPSPPPCEAADIRDPQRRHRALNAARYFQLVAGMNEPQWFAERLRQEQRRPRGRLHLLIGPAGVGKSSWAEEHLAGTVIVSSDRMREELTGDPADQSQNYLVFQRCMDRVREHLHEGRGVTFDATNCSEQLRAMPVQAGRWSGAEIASYFFDVSPGEAILRGRDRARGVPPDVVRRQFRSLTPPALYEADRHFVVDAEGGAVLYWPATEGRTEQ